MRQGVVRSLRKYNEKTGFAFQVGAPIVAGTVALGTYRMATATRTWFFLSASCHSRPMRRNMVDTKRKTAPRRSFRTSMKGFLIRRLRVQRLAKHRLMLRPTSLRTIHSALMPAALMIGHHVAISDF